MTFRECPAACWPAPIEGTPMSMPAGLQYRSVPPDVAGYCAVLPECQGQGLGKAVMGLLDAWLQSHAQGAYVSLIADGQAQVPTNGRCLPGHTNKNPRQCRGLLFVAGVPTGIRTPVATVKG
nr:GNAT family N-acetyltransferase [Stenotrophomonas rhizophila]